MNYNLNKILSLVDKKNDETIGFEELVAVVGWQIKNNLIFLF